MGLLGYKRRERLGMHYWEMPVKTQRGCEPGVEGRDEEG
jgi:hypothetical protein